MARTLVYTITAGRTGTKFLSELLRANLTNAEVHHERVNWLDLGVHCPDASHLTRFNTLGNLPGIRSFWQAKLARDLASEAEIYAEATHPHAKAGLIENLDHVPEDVRVVLIAQKRDPLKVVWSLHNRFDFVNFGFTWIFALDPRYRNVIVNSKQLRHYGVAGSALWYVIEMEVRAAYYRRLVANMPNVVFHDTSLEQIVCEDGARALLAAVTGTSPEAVTIPPPANELKNHHFGEDVHAQVAAMLDRVKWNAEELADAYFDAGRRLATPPWGPNA